MKTGLVIAIERELRAFLEQGEGIEEITVSNRTVYKTEMYGKEIYAIRSGYGLIDASAATQILISVFGCDTILNFGVTGALERGLKVDDLFLVEKTVHHEYDVSPIDPVKEHQYEEFPDEFIPLDAELFAKAMKIMPELKPAVDASGNRFVYKPEDKEYLNSLGCNICDMEIAAIARTSRICGAKCLSVKCISDTYDGDGGDFNANVIASAQKAFAVLAQIIKEL